MGYRHLTEGERYQIEALLRAMKSPAEIARQLGRSKSTISRELARNNGVVSRNPRKFRRPPRRSTGKLFDALGQTPERFVHIFQSLGFYALRA